MWLLQFVVMPALIAAITLGYTAQMVGLWYLAAISNDDFVGMATWFRW
jgi:hypothetical protein